MVSAFESPPSEKLLVMLKLDHLKINILTVIQNFLVSTDDKVMVKIFLFPLSTTKPEEFLDLIYTH